MMIIVTAMMHVRTGKKEAFILETKDLISATRKEEGCINYDLLANIEDENALVMLERWKDNDSLKKHLKTDQFLQFEVVIEPLLAKGVDIKSYSVDD
jgi:quinol monooxygenase YgiN